MQKLNIPNPPRLKMGPKAKLKKTLVLSTNNNFPIQSTIDSIQKNSHSHPLQTKQRIKQFQPALCWTKEKLEKAVQLFEMYQIGAPGISFSSIAENLQLSKEEVTEVWLNFQKNRNLQNFRKQIALNQKTIHSQDLYLRTKLVNMLKDNPFLTLTHSRATLTKQMKADSKIDFIIQEGKIAHLLKGMGYTDKKYSSIVTSKYHVQQMNQKRRYEFCRFIKKLLPTKTPMYFYHQTLFKKHHKSVKALVLCCMLGPSGLAVWILNESPFKKSYFQTLMQEMKKKQNCLDSIKRKHMILDKKVLTNKQKFCEVVQEHSFDILCLPSDSIHLSPIEKWFRILHSQLQTSINHQYYNLEVKLQQILKKYQFHSLYKYFVQFPKEIEQVLKNNQ